MLWYKSELKCVCVCTCVYVWGVGWGEGRCILQREKQKPKGYSLNSLIGEVQPVMCPKAVSLESSKPFS